VQKLRTLWWEWAERTHVVPAYSHAKHQK